MKRARVLSLFLTFLMIGCSGSGTVTDSNHPDNSSTTRLSAAAARGRDIWFKNTYGGEKFFAYLAQTGQLKVGFENVLLTPRDQRFAVWGAINDPDCHANPNGGLDVCPDPNATGVVGIRKFKQADGSYLYGVSCASCHAGFDPVNPPADPEEPTWANIHPSIGNQFLKTGKIFAANMAPTDIRALMLLSWPDGTVDTSLLFNDNIMNPGVFTAFWNHKSRNTFDVGTGTPQLRNGQGGEDDIGGQLAAVRVYTNIGVCFAECSGPAQATGQPIDIDACRQNCADFPPQQDLDDLVTFLDGITAPNYPGPGVSDAVMTNGKAVFEANCASCHDDSGKLSRVLSNDEMNSLQDMGNNAPNACRALGTNWDPGHIWAQFTSDYTHQRALTGTKGYRNMPLTGIWATAPFFHNQSIGPHAPPPNATPDEREAAYEQAMWELLSANRPIKANLTPFDITAPDGSTIPAGTPLTYIFSRDPSTGQLLCGDYVENKGHYYGTTLSDSDKSDLIQWLKYQ